MSCLAKHQKIYFSGVSALSRERPLLIGALWRLLLGITALFLVIASFTGAHAQNGVLGRGDAVVTGFSGVKPADAPIPAGGNPLDEFFIDLDGVSAQIQSLATLGAPPQGQLIAAPSRLQIKARQLGQVFAIALDDGQGAQAPNIYLGATSAYGLQIVIPDADGDGAPERSKKGHPSAQWMAGQFGIEAGGGPGAIWKVDGLTGAVSLFATLPNNAGPGVGDVVFDSASRQFFASDLDSGLIYRIDAGGQIVDSFDHGASGRPAKDLAPVNDDGVKLDITNAGFDSADPGTWGYTAAERRVHGMAIQAGRLYYAVDGQVWSIGISQAGFAGDARWEFDAKGLPGDGPVTDMLFDGQGRITLAQRGHQRNSYDYSVFADAEKSNVVRYRREEPDNPATESAWIEEPEAYAIGMPPEHNHAEGGIALGYAHDAGGMLRYGACGQMLWSTGHRLRPGADDGETGEADVHGLQGNDASLVRPQNTPPQQSYFADYDNLFGDAAKSGHVGDVEIWQPCEGASFAPSFGQLPPGILPPSDIPPDLPPEFPPEDYHTNLKLTKRAIPKVCSPWAGGWLCQYRVRITNTGPDNYFGPLLVRDWLPANPAGAVMGFSPTPPWACWATGPTAYNCFRPGVFLAPGWSTDLFAYVWVPGSYRPCHLVNAAAIEWAPPGSQWNSNPFDDVDFAVAMIPAQHCRPGERTDLEIKKVPYGQCYPFAGNIRCIYAISVQNLGPGTYNAPIVVEDTVPAGTTAIFGGAPWAPCAGPVGNTYTCTHPGANLASGAFAPPIFVAIDTPPALARQMQCRVRNHVQITQAPGNSPQNFDPTNDTADAVAVIPDEICHNRPRRSNLKIEKTALNVCLLQSGDWCRAFKITVTNTGPNTFSGPIQVTDIAPPGLTLNAGGAGWTCVGATCATNGAVVLAKNPPSGDSVSFSVTLEGTAAQAKAMNCRLTNKAKIDSPLGAPKNLLPGDDMDQISVALPGRFCEPVPQTNLKIEKRADPQVCTKVEQGWKCRWLITVTNIGGNYSGEIVLNETLPAEPVNASWNAPWSCVGDGNGGPEATCTHPNTDMGPGETRVLILDTVFSDAQVKRAQCQLRNAVAITKAQGGTPQNTDATDDTAEATASVPADFCGGSTIPSNLRIEKLAQQMCRATGNGWQCDYTVTVTNTGPGPYQGLLEVEDVLQNAGGAAMTAVPPQAFNWVCANAGQNTANCKILNASLAANENVYFHVRALAPANYETCSLTNTARILKAEGGSLQNGNAGDDESEATAQFAPAHDRCGPVLQTCPPGYSWNGERCVRPDPVCKRGWTPTPIKGQCCPPGQPWNQRLGKCGGDIPPPPPPACERGWTPTPVPGKCCPPGEPWNARLRECGRDIPPPPPVCPEGYRGQYPDCWKPEVPQCNKTARCIGGKVWSMEACACVCPAGAVMRHGRCVVGQPECPAGMVGTPPNCRQVECPRGMVGTPPNCRRPECPPDTVGVFPNCKKIEIDRPCPPGTVGRFPNCKKIEIDRPCPPGTVGRFPNCRKIEIDRPCPPGTVGRFPNCRKIEIERSCPPGTVGRFPNCRKIEIERPCPRGTFGRQPNCRPIIRVCPPGTFGRPPLCRRPEGRPQIPFRPGGQILRPDIGPRFTPRPGGGQGPLR
jgi:hypothetical protein